MAHMLFIFTFFFNDTATTEIYTLSLHRRSSDLLPVLAHRQHHEVPVALELVVERPGLREDRKSTRLNSSHRTSSYAVFCLKKKNLHRARNTGLHDAAHECLARRVRD